MKLDITSVSFSYKHRKVLENVGFSVEGGTFCALIGPNGAGKSTILKCINGILTPSSGTVFADGIDVFSLTLKERAAIFGYVPQFMAVNPCLNVIETVISGRMPHMRSRVTRVDIEQAERVLVYMGLEEFSFRPLHQLSGGERQRALIARAMAQEPKVLLLDEPTSNLDLRYQLETMHILKEMSAEHHISVIAVIHDLNSVLRFSDQAVLLHSGVVRSDGKPGQVITKENLAETFRISAEFTQSGGIPIMVPASSLGDAAGTERN